MDVVIATDFLKNALSKVLSEHLNTEEALCEIIEHRYPKYTLATKVKLMDMCESALPLMIKIDSITKE